jgi:hypothetical protein
VDLAVGFVGVEREGQGVVPGEGHAEVGGQGGCEG